MSALNNPHLAAIEPLLQAAQEDLDTAYGQLADALQTTAADGDIIATLNQKLATALQSVTSLQSELDAANSQLSADAATIAKLGAQLATALANGQLPSSFLKQFTNLQSLAGWVLAGGTAGNTGQTGSKGTGSYTQNPDGTMTLLIQPNGPYYDGFFYRKMAAPAPVLNVIVYRAAFLLDSVNFPLCQALEMDGSWYDGHFRFQPAAQIEMHSKTLRYYDPNLPDWVSTGVIVNPQPGQWMDVEIVCKCDRTAGLLTYVSAAINGVVHPLNITVKCKPHTEAAFIESSLQLDSNSKGAAYQATVDRVGMGWL